MGASRRLPAGRRLARACRVLVLARGYARGRSGAIWHCPCQFRCDTMVNRIFDGAIEQLTRGLAFATRRHQVIVQNVANLETPGYRARDLVFDDFLHAPPAPAPDLPEPLPPVGDRVPRLVLAGDGAVRPSGNDVHLDHQMSRLAETTLFHGALTQVLHSQFAALKQAITGRV